MTDGMIEQVARAMFERDLDHGPWKQRSEAQENIYLADARAAITAMREPTTNMCEASLREDFAEADKFGSYAGPIKRWQAMIDAALNGGE